MRLTVLGRSPARPNPGEACAGYLIEGGGSRILMDVGPGVVAQLLRRNTPDELDAVVISHMHTDHCLDLITLRYSYPWIDVAKQRLTVIVPPGSTGQLAEMALGAGYANFFDKSFIFVEHDGKRPIEVGNLRLEPEETQHYVRTWGFRITARGPDEDPNRILTYSADTRPVRRAAAPGRSAPTCSCARPRCDRSGRTTPSPRAAATCSPPRRPRPRATPAPGGCC